jgi:hypothetical protein
MADQRAPAAAKVDQWSLLDRLKTTFHRRVTVFARSIAYSGRQDALPPPAHCRVVDLGAQDAAAYAAFRPRQGAEIFHQWLARGARCTAVLRDGDIVHVGWSILGRAHAPYLDRDLVLGPGDVFMFDIYTRPDARLTNAGALRAEHVRRVTAELGCERSLSIVAVENTVGARYTRALGYRDIGWYTYWRLGPWSRWRAEPCPGERLPDLVAPA